MLEVANNGVHYIDTGRVNYYHPDLFTNFNQGMYAINKKLAEKDRIDYSFVAEKGLVMPSIHFRPQGIKKYNIKDIWLKPVNFDCTFMTKNQIVRKHRDFARAILSIFPNHPMGFDPATASDEDVFTAWSKGRSHKLLNAIEFKNFLPNNVKDLVASIDQNSWGGRK
jgi:hypothetical protein